MIRALLLALVFSAATAGAGEIPADLPEDVRDVAMETLRDPDLADLTKTCPDQIWQTQSVGIGGLLGACETARGCRRSCGWGSTDACFDLARIMQDLEPEMPLAVSERWFARACALGKASGCTNRAAGILVNEDDDPFSALPYRQAKECAARTFTLSCAADDAWGCTMHARDLAEGVLDEPDANAAKAAARKACVLEGTDNVGACDAARRWVLD